MRNRIVGLTGAVWGGMNLPRWMPGEQPVGSNDLVSIHFEVARIDRGPRYHSPK